jgi:hypothetical protein
MTMKAEAIKIRIAGVFSGEPMNELLEESLQPNDTPASVIIRLDKRKIFGRKFFKNLLDNDRAVFLLNGERLELETLRQLKLKSGDEISVLSAIAGG